MIDLHVHTTASDGSDTPAEVVEKAAAIGLSAIAITDHDTVEGIDSAMAAGKEHRVEVVPGIEISTEYAGHDIHILGYYIDYASAKLQPVLDWVINDRNARNEKIIEKLASDGYDISIEELKAKHPDTVIGRPHIAECLLEKGYVNSVAQAFSEFLAKGRPYFLPRKYLPLQRTIDVIREAGGIAVIAHPLQYRFDNEDLKKFLKTAKDMGAEGMEVIYPKYSDEQSAFLSSIADYMSLLKTGGSDYHGSIKPDIKLGVGMGAMNVPDEYLDMLKRRR